MRAVHLLQFMHRCCLWLCLSLGLGPSAQAQPVSQLVPGVNGLALKTWVFHPAQKTHATPRPVVIVLHGYGGIHATVGTRNCQLSARHQGMTDLLLAQGYSVVWPDSSHPDKKPVCANKAWRRAKSNTCLVSPMAHIRVWAFTLGATP